MKRICMRKLLSKVYWAFLFLLITHVSEAQIQVDSMPLPTGYTNNVLRQRSDMIARQNGEVWISFYTLGVFHYTGSSWVIYNPQNTSNQLPSLQVHKLCLDSSGAMWMANELSLTRMDVNGFKNYFFSSPYNNVSDPITDLVESQGKVIMSTKHGLYVLDTLTSVWQSYTTQNSNLPNDVLK
mgnify:FL=1